MLARRARGDVGRDGTGIGAPLEQGRALLGRVREFTAEPRFGYRHKWRRGDPVIWDNRTVLHRGRHTVPDEAVGPA